MEPLRCTKRFCHCFNDYYELDIEEKPHSGSMNINTQLNRSK